MGNCTCFSTTPVTAEEEIFAKISPIENDLLVACDEGDVELINKIYQVFASSKFDPILLDVECESAIGATPLKKASSYGHVELVRILLDQFGANINSHGGFRNGHGILHGTPLYLSMKYNHLDVMYELLSHPECDINQRSNRYEITPLMVSCRRNFYIGSWFLLHCSIPDDIYWTVYFNDSQNNNNNNNNNNNKSTMTNSPYTLKIAGHEYSREDFEYFIRNTFIRHHNIMYKNECMWRNGRSNEKEEEEEDSQDYKYSDNSKQEKQKESFYKPKYEKTTEKADSTSIVDENYRQTRKNKAKLTTPRFNDKNISTTSSARQYPSRDVNIHACEANSGFNALHLAAMHNPKAHIMRMLLAFGANPDRVIAENGETALHRCLTGWMLNDEDKKSKVESLLVYNANPFVANKDGEIPFDKSNEVGIDSRIGAILQLGMQDYSEEKQFLIP